MKRIVFFGLLLILGCVYWQTAARTNPGYGDSDEILTTGFLRSVSHPSGYAVTVTLAHWFMQLPIIGSVAFKGNILSLILHAIGMASLGLIGVSLFEQIRDLPGKHLKYFWSIVILVGVLLTGLSALIWLYAGVLEVNALNIALAPVCVLLILRWRVAYRQGKHPYLYLLACAALCGLGLANVHTFVLVFPGIGVIYLGTLWEEGRERFTWKATGVGIVVLFLGFFLPNLLLFMYNDPEAALTWAFEPNWNGWWRLISRRDYVGFIPEQSRSVAAYVSVHTITHYWDGFRYYWSFLIDHFTALGLGMGLWGLLWSQKNLGKVEWWGLALLWFVPGLLLATYMGIPDSGPMNLQYRMNIGISHRQLLLGEVMWGVFIILGIFALISSLVRIIKQTKIALLLGIAISTGLVLGLFRSNYSMANQSTNTFAHDYAKAMLDGAAPDSVIICFSDISCYSLLYLSIVEHVRPDVQVLIKNNYYQRYYLDKHPELYGFLYGTNPYFTAELLSWNVHQRPTYITEPDGFYIQYVGLDGDPFYIIPEGLLYRVLTQVPEAVPEQNFAFGKRLLEMQIPEKNYFSAGLKDYFTHKHTVNGVILSKMGAKELSAMHFELGVALNPTYPEPQKFLLDLALYPGEPRYAPGTQGPNGEQLFADFETNITQAQNEQNNDLLNTAYSTLLRATFREPLNATYRLRLARMYIDGGFVQEGTWQLKYILNHEPTHTEAQELLDQMKL